jgi:hypothetical protein
VNWVQRETAQDALCELEPMAGAGEVKTQRVLSDGDRVASLALIEGAADSLRTAEVLIDVAPFTALAREQISEALEAISNALDLLRRHIMVVRK